MIIKTEVSVWGSAWYFGPYIDRQDWNIWHHTFKIGFNFARWTFSLEITLWDIEDTIEMLEDRGMTKDEAWKFVERVREALPDPYSHRVKMWKEVEKALEIGEV